MGGAVNELALAQARVKAAGLQNVEFAVAPAEDLKAWKDGTFNAATVNLVLMFVEDKAKSLEELARVLVPGGFAYVSVWSSFPFYDLTLTALQEVSGKSLPASSISPLALNSKGAVDKLAAGANLEVVHREDLTYSFKMPTAKDTATACAMVA